MKKFLITAAAAALVAGNAMATNVGVIYIQKILAQSEPAVAAQAKLNKIFKPRQEELDKLIRDFRTRAAKYEKNQAVLSEAERIKQRQALGETERDIERKRRALIEESQQKGNEETQIILSQVRKIIPEVAKDRKLDVILQDAVWANAQTDITNEVISRLNKAPKK